ncbi:MAG: OmpA family protein [Elusimicrobiota bacterium]|jgi:outer membrane protein OmpA-like peptidoglycan-associated protein|nr:OmpA family protein [Elusimicrobiota bacterium]
MQLQQAMQQTPLFNNIEQQKTADTGSEPSISSLDARLSVVELGMTVNAGENVAPQSQFQSRQTFIEEEDDEEIRTLDDNALNAEIAQAQSRKSNSSAAKSAIRAFSLSAATFRPGSFDLTDAAKRAINRLANEIKKRPYKKIVIEGHTDASGDIQKNLVLSHKRAREVRKELYKNGIPLNKMAYIGFGPTMPIAANNTDLGRSKNRRVEIYVE